MRLALTAAAVAAGIAAFGMTAQAVEIGIGPGGVRVDHDRDCRVIIDHHTNRYGEDVTVRRRVCD
jgi:hypothetical protein